MRTITLADHAGFCFGVGQAVDRAAEELEKAQKQGTKLYCLGSLIHNKAVTAEFAEKGMRTVTDLDEVPEGSSLLIRAHGEPPETFVRADKKQLTLIDATCPFVSKIHRLASEAAARQRRVVIIGDPAHPEVKGITGWAGLSALTINDPADADAASDLLKSQPVTVVAQTTITGEKFSACVDRIRTYARDVVVCDTICQATKQRQDCAQKLAEKSDLMIVIGDRTSSNAQKLVEICEKVCKTVLFVENSDELPLHEFEKYCKIGVAASASAPERIIKEVIATMSEDFTKDLQAEETNEMSAFMDEIEKSLRLPGRGEVITGEVVQVTDDYIVINLGCKKDGILPKSEMVLEDDRELTALFKEGDEIQAKVIKSDDGDGNILLSKKKLQSGVHWDEITAALDSKEVVNATVVKEVKGGVIATYKEVSGFIPMSQLADHYVESAAEYVGKTLPVKVTRVDQRRNKAVFSHKAFLNEEKYKKIAEIWQTLNVGDVVEGKVMRFTDYGAFVDIGGLDGLLHISEISWGKLKHPQEALDIGQIINVKILSMNEEKGKISLGLKQNTPEPWSVIDENYAEGQIIDGKVVQIKEYGAFVELEPGLDGLVHISEVAHKRVNKISEELNIGQMVQAKVLEIDRERRRISLSIKETLDPNAPQPEAYPEESVESPEESIPETEEIIEEAAEDVPATEAVEETVVEEAAVEDEVAAAEEAPAEEPVPDSDVPNLKNMKKAELAAFAEEKDIELPSKATNAEMIQIIEAALE
ncbi:MAG: bifunctional 4-hydroxy-3-methylbut-2-enyl diphosphate reductase/30S ribosomal protein S1 [Eubacteriales bacterium]|nr:bifunctional 4-hydroxy-3-methylbut-2-enyl diphosphate reductase/30S ribosomal protein S1 [Eubacteriales bacterium]HPF18598.1 bifunctional 4-hydroxy-3-methylbut-2-enyl diphosphate reductase/30S ribosomal protein S1 [Bacillota bacterium]